MTWSNNLIRLRRFLRDPNGKIWSDALIRNQFNAAQKDLQRRTNYLDDVSVVHVPPLFSEAYLHDFEWAFLASSTGNYQALRYHQQGEISFCYRFEAQAVWWGLAETTAPDEGTHFTQPWEALMNVVPGDIVPLQYPRGFHVAKYVAYDKEPIDYIPLKRIQQDDSSWYTRTGEPEGYWRPDRFEDMFCLYPVPSTVSWEDPVMTVGDVEYVYTFDFEYDEAYLTGESWNYTREDTTDSVQYLFDWELEIGEVADEVVMRGQWLFEIDYDPVAVGIGMIIHTSADTETAETGTIIDNGDIASAEMGIATDIGNLDENVLFVYSKTPTDIVDATDESDWPDYLQKYAEYGALENCYAADTDGQIQSLRDYWKLRYDMGIKAIERFKSLRRQDRDYRLVTKGAPGLRTKRQPRLPDHYPATY